MQARNYKKLLAAVQKTKILEKVEIDALFSKANRFLDKKSIARTKEEMKYQIKAQYMAMDENQFEERHKKKWMEKKTEKS